MPTMLVSMNAAGPVDRAVDVRFGGEVDDRARPVLAQQRADQRGVADVAAHEHVPRVARERLRLPRLPA